MTDRPPATAPISVVIPVRDDAAALVGALESLRTQTTPVEEIVVVDDGSEEPLKLPIGSPEATHVRLIRTEGIGVSAARNAGANAAASPYLAFLDADDRMEPDWATTIASLIEPGVKVVSCGALIEMVTDRGRHTIESLPTPKGPSYGGLRGVFLSGAYVISKQLFDSLGGFDAEVSYGEHHELAMRIGQNIGPDQLRSAEQLLLRCFIDRTGPRIRAYAERRYRSALYLVEKHRRTLAHDRQHLSSLYSVAAYSAFLTGRRREAVRLSMVAFFTMPTPRRMARIGRYALAVRPRR